VIIANHSSMADIMLVVKNPFVLLVRELAKVPLFGFL
jgi:1-acyl-sn-glycerol-3-phosphate acyltransferase